MDAVLIEPPHYTCVVAVDAAGGIGNGNDLPWPRLPGDRAHFKRITTATRDPARRNAVIMGRRTWDSLGKYRPLPGRINIVVSRTPGSIEGADAVADSLEHAVAAAMTAAAESIHLVGGGQLYALAVADPTCELLYYTHVDATFATDTAFPPFADRFVLEAEDPPREESGVRYWFQRWRRRHKIAP